MSRPIPEEIRDEFRELTNTTVKKLREAVHGVPIIVAVQSCLNVVRSAADQVPSPTISLALARTLKEIGQELEDGVVEKHPHLAAKIDPTKH